MVIFINNMVMNLADFDPQYKLPCLLKDIFSCMPLLMQSAYFADCISLQPERLGFIFFLHVYVILSKKCNTLNIAVVDLSILTETVLHFCRKFEHLIKSGIFTDFTETISTEILYHILVLECEHNQGSL